MMAIANPWKEVLSNLFLVCKVSLVGIHCKSSLPGSKLSSEIPSLCSPAIFLGHKQGPRDYTLPPNQTSSKQRATSSHTSWSRFISCSSCSCAPGPNLGVRDPHSWPHKHPLRNQRVGMPGNQVSYHRRGGYVSQSGPKYSCGQPKFGRRGVIRFASPSTLALSLREPSGTPSKWIQNR